MGQGLGIQVAELDGSSSIVVTAIHCVKMDKTGHAAGSYKLLYFFPSTIIKYSSSLSAHITLCPGSLGKMSSSKAICQVSQMCFSELFQAVSPPFYVEHCLFHEISHTKCFFLQKTPVFHQSCFTRVFHSGLGALASAFPDTHLHGGRLQGSVEGSSQTGHTWGPPVWLQGQWVMLIALSPSLVGLISGQSGSCYLHLTFFLHY